MALRQFAGDFAVLSLLIAGVTGGLVYLAVLLLLVRPMRRITGSIAAFRADPEHTTPLNPGDVTVLPDDEMAVAGRELAAMQHELRAALWRNARLAALGTVVAKVSHDLRGILTPALLIGGAAAAQCRPEGAACRRDAGAGCRPCHRSGAANTGLRARRTAAAGTSPLSSSRRWWTKPPRPRGRRAAACVSNNAIDLSILVQADRIQLFRVLANLLRNAAEAGARTVHGSRPSMPAPPLLIDIADDGPGPAGAGARRTVPPVRRQYPPRRAGLGLAIARDLMVAHGGEIELVETGATGTTFRLTLRLVDSTRRAAEATAHADCSCSGRRRIGRAYARGGGYGARTMACARC